MKSVEYLLGSETVNRLPLPVYGKDALSFCAELSKALLGSPLCRFYPDLTALAFWCRRGNLQKLKERCPEAENRLGRGLCFHVTPGNIPVNFAFSWLFGILSGCANVVRLPSRVFPQADVLCGIVREMLPAFPEIADRTAFVRYAPAERMITAHFSAMSDVRLLWGGDATISALRGFPTKPRCVDVCFADRWSLCLLDGGAVEMAEKSVLLRLAEGFYNDTFLMDQNACSSPMLVLWQNDSPKARERFWKALSDLAEERYELQPAVGVDKYTQLFKDALDGRPIRKIVREGGFVYRVELSELPADMTELRGSGGYFYEYAVKSLDELLPRVTEKIQTLSYFGVDPAYLRGLTLENRLMGIDRIVPVGRAMDIGILWDGYDLPRMLSRYVALE